MVVRQNKRNDKGGGKKPMRHNDTYTNKDIQKELGLTKMQVIGELEASNKELIEKLINIVDKCISSQGYVIVKRDEVYCGCGKKLRTSCELCDNDCM